MFIKLRIILFFVAILFFSLLLRNNSFTENALNSPQLKSKIYDFNLYKKKEAIRDAMKHAWRGYETYAFGKDELLPVSSSYNQNWGVTLLDSLDTLYIMEMHDEFNRAKKHVEKIQFNTTLPGHQTSLFETVIRSLGGLISAYELDESPIFLKKATELAELEFQKLSILTGNKTYYDKTQKFIDLMENSKKPISGLYPRDIDIFSGELSGKISVDAMADSFYEYLLKLYLMYGKNGEQYRRMYESFVDSAKKHMIFKSSGKLGLTFVSDLDYKDYLPDGHMGHLSCFLPGLLALGSKELNRKHDLETAKELMKTCYTLYETSATGLAPEDVYFNFDLNNIESASNSNFNPGANRNPKKDTDFDVENTSYVLRPETVESLMILYRVTGDSIYRTSMTKINISTGKIQWKVGCSSAQECIALSQTGFAKKLGVTQKQAEAKWEEICNSVIPIDKAFAPISQLVNTCNFLTVGDPQIDFCLGGGIRAGMLTEIAGESSAGKTQFCLQLCLTVQLPIEMGGFGGAAAYISTEAKFPIKRLSNLLPNFYNRLSIPGYTLNEIDSNCVNNQNNLVENVLKNVHTKLYLSKNQFVFAILYQLADYVERNGIKLLIIDSIAGIMRFGDQEPFTISQKDKSWVFDRDKTLFLISTQLKIIATRFSCAVVCINQVSDKFMENSERNVHDIVEKIPALGKQWSSMINARILLQLKRSNISSSVDKIEGGIVDHLNKNRRWIEAINIPWAYPRKCEFQILNSGIKSII
ncbi:hypothetical protein BB561_006956, partial [Smittium simulii]